LDWLLKNAHLYGFSWEVQSEPWHLRYVAGDDVPEAVTKWKKSRG
jgi:LAS superfamily LD-carboxypeptidase LdcB